MGELHQRDTPAHRDTRLLLSVRIYDCDGGTSSTAVVLKVFELKVLLSTVSFIQGTPELKFFYHFA